MWYPTKKLKLKYKQLRIPQVALNNTILFNNTTYFFVITRFILRIRSSALHLFLLSYEEITLLTLSKQNINAIIEPWIQILLFDCEGVHHQEHEDVKWCYGHQCKRCWSCGHSPFLSLFRVNLILKCVKYPARYHGSYFMTVGKLGK